MISAVFLHHNFSGEDFLHAAGLLLTSGDRAILDSILLVDDRNISGCLDRNRWPIAV